MVQRKLNSKKKNEKSLSALIKQINQNTNQAPGGEATAPTAQDIQA
jgi:hypothetical protein